MKLITDKETNGLTSKEFTQFLKTPTPYSSFTKEEADELIKFAKKVPCKVNLIEYNPIELANFKGSSVDKIAEFGRRVEAAGIIVNVRRSRGKDIDAACGQLANKI